MFVRNILGNALLGVVDWKITHLASLRCWAASLSAPSDSLMAIKKSVSISVKTSQLFHSGWLTSWLCGALAYSKMMVKGDSFFI
jgi:hypothetical protein